MKARMFGVEFEVEEVSRKDLEIEGSMGKDVEILFSVPDVKEVIKKVIKGLEEAQKEEVHDEEAPCFCWQCRQGAGIPEVMLYGEWGPAFEFIPDGVDGVGYTTGSCRGHYELTNKGLVYWGSRRSLRDGSEYAAIDLG